jgi:hypothetical protein
MVMVRFPQLVKAGGMLCVIGLTLGIANESAWAGSVSFPISVPPECISLAQREGVPTMIENRYQAAKARLKLARLNGSDPMVQECRAAVKRAVVAMKREQIAEKAQAKLARAAATE